MITGNQTRAGDNERRFVDVFNTRIPGTELCGKQRYLRNGVEISVDNSFHHNAVEYLVEIDSGNMAKLIVGQYILINCLRKKTAHEVFFIAVHTYKNYNPQRTSKNLELVNHQVLGGQGIPFGSIHIDKLENSAISSIGDLLSALVRV